MKWNSRRLAICALFSGLLAAGLLSLAVSTDYWIYMQELALHSEANFSFVVPVNTHGGLWRSCVYYESGPELGEGEIALPPICENIGWNQEKKPDGADTSNSVIRATLRSVPIIVSGLFVQLIALGCSTVGNAKKDLRTLIGAIVYILAALILAVGVIVYISAVNDDVSHRKKPSADGVGFHYKYGWAFFFAGASFISSMVAAVFDISFYVRQISTADDSSTNSCHLIQ